MQEAWEWYMKDYKMAFENKKKIISPRLQEGVLLVS